jgi:hypothetical protein
MSGHTPEFYTIFCVLESDPNREFCVRVEASATFYDVQKAIVKEDKVLNDLNPKELELYQVDVQGPPKSREHAIKKIIARLEDEEPLDPLQELSGVYAKPPAKGTVHILVQNSHRGRKIDSKS